MDIYHIHPDTGEFKGQGTARPNPFQVVEFLIPANTTTIVPPAASANQVAVYSGGGWSVEPDFGGET